jgi:hypothetical protein
MILGVTSSKGYGLHVTEMATQIFILQKNNIRWFRPVPKLYQPYEFHL